MHPCGTIATEAVKFTIKKLGPVEKAEMRLGRLTVIAGKNNTGKTYLAYAIYGFLRMVAGRDYPMMLTRKMVPDFTALGRRVAPRSVSEQLSLDEVEGAVKTALGEYCHIFSRRGIADALAAERPPKGFSLSCEIPPIQWPDTLDEKMGRKELRGMGLFASVMGDVEFRRQGDRILYTADDARHPKSASKGVALGCIGGYMLAGQMPLPFIVPAERFGVHLFYKELDFTKSRLVEMLQKLPEKGRGGYGAPMLIRDSSARYAQPIADYIDYVRQMDQPEHSGKANGRKLHHPIEDMMDGHYEHDDSNGILFVSKAGKNGFRLPLHLASSSARGLAGLYFRIKQKPRPGDFLIIDEPEAHLHPENQIKMAQLLARCVNAGWRVLVTTHSDYIVKELNNLIMLSGDINPKGKAKFLSKHKHYDKNDYIKQGDVCAYVCENGGLAKCDIDSRGMRMDSFNAPILETDSISTELDTLLPEEKQPEA